MRATSELVRLGYLWILSVCCSGCKENSLLLNGQRWRREAPTLQAPSSQREGSEGTQSVRRIRLWESCRDSPGQTGHAQSSILPRTWHEPSLAEHSAHFRWRSWQGNEAKVVPGQPPWFIRTGAFPWSSARVQWSTPIHLSKHSPRASLPNTRYF